MRPWYRRDHVVFNVLAIGSIIITILLVKAGVFTIPESVIVAQGLIIAIVNILLAAWHGS